MSSENKWHGFSNPCLFRRRRLGTPVVLRKNPTDIPSWSSPMSRRLLPILALKYLPFRLSAVGLFTLVSIPKSFTFWSRGPWFTIRRHSGGLNSRLLLFRPYPSYLLLRPWNYQVGQAWTFVPKAMLICRHWLLYRQVINHLVARDPFLDVWSDGCLSHNFITVIFILISLFEYRGRQSVRKEPVFI